MLALSSPVFAEGVKGTTDKTPASAYTGTTGTSGITTRAAGEDPATTNFMNDTRSYRRYDVNGDDNGLMDRTERAVRGTGRAMTNTVRAAATDADNDFDWGWLGLLGLIGLAGLRGRMRQTS
jgi:hypothetical protein